MYAVGWEWVKVLEQYAQNLMYNSNYLLSVGISKQQITEEKLTPISEGEGYAETPRTERTPRPVEIQIEGKMSDHSNKKDLTN